VAGSRKFGRGMDPLQIAGDGSFAFGWSCEAMTFVSAHPKGCGSSQFI
jgi:hypothetical protein